MKSIKAILFLIIISVIIKLWIIGVMVFCGYLIYVGISSLSDKNNSVPQKTKCQCQAWERCHLCHIEDDDVDPGNKQGYIYLTKQYNSDGREIRHEVGGYSYSKIGIGKTNNIERRKREHNRGGSKIGDIEIRFIHHHKVGNMDHVEREIHRILENRGFLRLQRTNGTRTEVFTYNTKTKEDLSEETIINIINQI